MRAIRSFPHHCLRTPTFPISFYTKALLANNFEELLVVLDNPYFKEALFLASPELLILLQKVKESPTSFSEKQKQALYFSLLKYIARISNRCTPFGLFAGISVGEISTQETHIELQNTNQFTRHTQFDTHFWIALLQKLSKNNQVQEYLLFFPNNSLYKIGSFYRFIEYQYVNKKRVHKVSALQVSELLETILITAKQGATITELVTAIIEEETEREEAQEFVLQLIDFQFLTSELEATVTGKEDVNTLLQTLSKIPELEDLKQVLEILVKQLAQLDDSITAEITLYDSIKQTIEKFDLEFEEKYLFQTDVSLTTQNNNLNQNIERKVTQTLHFLNGIQKTYPNKNLQNFIKAYQERYESAEMPLSLVLDPEVGIGYLQNTDNNDSHPILEKFTFRSKEEDSTSENWNENHYILEKKLKEFYENEENYISLSEKDFPNFKTDFSKLPATFSVMLELIQNEGKEVVSIESSGSISAAKLLGRFANGNEDIHELTKSIVAKEAEFFKDKLMAEIVHIPEARLGNILRRPVLRPYEIPYLGKSSVPEENQITIDDLMISIKNNSVILRSKKHQKEVIPCLSNAHNYSANALPMYHFLADLQGQNSEPIYSFGWGILENHYSYFPRVYYKDVIIAKAKWMISKKEIEVFYTNLKEFSVWKEQKKLPKYVNWVVSDNTLLIDLENETSIQLLLDSVKKYTKFTLEEFLFTEESIVKNVDNESFTNQIILSYYTE